MYTDTHTRMQARMHAERSISHKKKKTIKRNLAIWDNMDGPRGLNDFTYLKTLKKKKKTPKTNGQTKNKNKSYRYRKETGSCQRGEWWEEERQVRKTKTHKLPVVK